MKTNIYFLAILIGALLMTSCSDDDPEPEVVHNFPIGENGFFIVNEGGWGNGDASLSYYNRDSSEVYNDIFQTYAGRPLGDQAQSMSLIDSLGFIVVQNSVKIEVIHAYKFTSVTTIDGDDGLESPRYVLGVNENKAYITDWGSTGVNGTVKVLDLNTYEITKTISTGNGANKLIKRGDKVYVANQGGYSRDSTIAVIDVNTDELLKKIEVKGNPESLQLDADGNIWVAGNGITIYNADYTEIIRQTPGYIARIGEDDEVDFIWEATEGTGDINRLTINEAGDELYYSHAGGVYKLSTSATELPASALVSKSFYGLGFDPVSKEIIGGEAPNFSSAGTMYFYNTSGVETGSESVGIGPNSFVFRNN
ncbi:YncE family protein [Fulvivirga ligni]|uniref:YncE family protein n=1 Tax=Fulvivirga ligni TaxID=2904246 RepID=UPI001F28EDE6|nr:DUF5074 domain-containing protein [Fulvivirga ligni]UII21728.1 hypothetical protein LVD16_00560 [Fulvivirga ligni]